jgi:hypothetical protein
MFEEIEGIFAVTHRLYLKILFSEDKFDYLLYGNAIICE